MPIYETANGTVRANLTADEAALVRGMNYRGERIQWSACGPSTFGTNIAALHFDGPVLIDLLKARKEIADKLRQA